jgi:hypothetical protein
MIKYLRRTTSGAAGIGLGATMMYLQRTKSGVAGKGLGTTAIHLRRTTSDSAGNGLSRYRELLMPPFTTSASLSPCFMRAFFTNIQNSTAKVRGFRYLVCVCGARARSLCS